MPSQKQFNITIEPDVLDRLDVVAESSHMKKNQLASVVLGIFSEIEPKLALTALGEIKAKYGKRVGPGRPPSRPRSASSDDRAAA